MEETTILLTKLSEYRNQLKDELKALAAPDKQEREELETRLKELSAESVKIKERIQQIKDSYKDNKSKILAIARKLKAIDQLIE